jgi:NADPH2:quinone reductase
LRLLGYTNNELTRAQRAEAIAVIAARVADDTLTVTHETVAPADAPAAWARRAAGAAGGRLVVVPSAQ